MSSSSIHNRHEPSTDLARKWLTPDFFKAMHDYWFRDLSPDALTPDQDTTKRWFAKDESNDQFCRNTYLPFLEDVRRLQPSPKDLMLDPEENPTNTLTLLLLLDQIPRNVFRGQESKVVFTIYDKLALDIALRSLFPKTHQAAISKVPPMSSLADNHDNNNNNRTWYEDDTVTMDDEEGLNSGLDNIPQYRYHCGYRMWFYLPLMHSESLKIHDWADKRFQAMIADMESLRERPLTSSSGKTYTPEEIDQACKAAKGLYGFQVQHTDILKRFGRYPHRNKPLGRESTVEEKEYLEKGGMTFGN